MCLKQVTADHTAIGFAENSMQMQRRALIADGNIAEQSEDFHLFVDGDVLVLLCLPLEIAEQRTAERADRRN